MKKSNYPDSQKLNLDLCEPMEFLSLPLEIQVCGNQTFSEWKLWNKFLINGWAKSWLCADDFKVFIPHSLFSIKILLSQLLSVSYSEWNPTVKLVTQFVLFNLSLRYCFTVNILFLHCVLWEYSFSRWRYWKCFYLTTQGKKSLLKGGFVNHEVHKYSDW